MQNMLQNYKMNFGCKYDAMHALLLEFGIPDKRPTFFEKLYQVQYIRHVVLPNILYALDILQVHATKRLMSTIRCVLKK